MVTGLENCGKIVENREADVENIGFYYAVDYTSVYLLLCFLLMSSFTFMSPMWYLENTTRLFQSKKFCHFCILYTYLLTYLYTR